MDERAEQSPLQEKVLTGLLLKAIYALTGVTCICSSHQSIHCTGSNSSSRIQAPPALSDVSSLLEEQVHQTK